MGTVYTVCTVDRIKMKELKYFKLLPKFLTSLSNKNVERVSDLTLTPHHPIRQSQHIWLSKAGSFLNNREFPEKNPSQWFASFFWCPPCFVEKVNYFLNYFFLFMFKDTTSGGKSHPFICGRVCIKISTPNVYVILHRHPGQVLSMNTYEEYLKLILILSWWLV